MSATGAARRHAWLELIQQSGPFLTVPVADRIWPTGLPAVPAGVRAKVRAAVAELMDTGGSARNELTRQLFGDALEWNDAHVEAGDIPASIAETVAEHGVLIRPDFAFRAEPDDDDDDGDVADLSTDEPDEDDEETGDNESAGAPPPAAASAGPWRLLGRWSAWGRHPLARYVESGWSASPVERLAALLRARDVPLGLVSDGRWWAIVWAPRGRPVGVGIFDATLWSEEPETFAAFVALLHRRRFLGVAQDERLPALLEASAAAQEDVTTALGGQVRNAVEMLVRRFDELDRYAGGAILRDVSDDELYAAVVTVMMRVIFLLFAEERQLLPSDDARYDTSYSMGRLVEQLEQRAAIHGEQTLEHRTGAWHRMLALARALHGGVAHEDLRLPPYGGGLFDPDRYPWLEGRGGTPPAVDDLTVLRMLEAVQYVHLAGERRRLTFRALDVEQIGYVYEGLLEMEVRTADEPVLGLERRGKKGLSLIRLTDALAAIEILPEWTATAYLGEKKATPARSKSAAAWLAAEAPARTMIGLHEVLGPETAEDLRPLAGLVGRDDRDRPLITPKAGATSPHPPGVPPPARITPHDHSPRRSSSTPSNRWSTGPGLSKRSTRPNGSCAPPPTSSPCEPRISPPVRAPSSSPPAGSSPTASSKPGTAKATPRPVAPSRNAPSRQPTPKSAESNCEPGAW